jgi:molybdenum cofactor guanylyltransferase
MPISGAVLAGGRSARFGTDKAAFVWHGRTLLEHGLTGLEVCAERFVIGGSQQPHGIPVYPDSEPFAGSLHGLARALEVANCERVAVTACDMPNLSGTYWAWLAGLDANDPDDAIIPENAAGFLEPLAAVYTKRCLPFVRAAIEAKALKMTGWWSAHLEGRAPLRVARVPWLEVRRRFGDNVFLNANTPGDLERG